MPEVLMCMLPTDHYSFPFWGGLSGQSHSYWAMFISSVSPYLPLTSQGKLWEELICSITLRVTMHLSLKVSINNRDQVCWNRGVHALIPQHVLPPIVPGICLWSGCESWLTCRKWALYSLIHGSLSDRYRPCGHSTLSSSRAGSWR